MSAGLERAALIAWKPALIIASIRVSIPVSINVPRPMFTRNGNSFKKSFINKKARGQAITLAKAIRIKNSLDSIETIFDAEAPITFLIPISFDLFSAVYETNPKIPKQAIAIVINENEKKCF